VASCLCDPGYAGEDCSGCAADHQDYGDGSCRPADPCGLYTLCAGLHRTCENLQGQPFCGLCLGGYHQAGNVCAEDLTCQPSSCSGHGVCDDDGGGIWCSCDVGYAGRDCSMCANGFLDDGQGHCVPNGESCQASSCNGHGTCSDAGGIVACTCDAGYQGSRCESCAVGYVTWPSDGSICVDDPCLPDPCSMAHSQANSCNQTSASEFSCTCEAGYQWQAGACALIEECIDPDEDGYGAGTACLGPDCAPDDPAVNPGAQEVCDGLDNDCDGDTDPGCPRLSTIGDVQYGVVAEGALVSIKAVVVTARTADLKWFWIQDPVSPGGYSGVAVFFPAGAPADVPVGSLVDVIGQTDEYLGLTELVNATFMVTGTAAVPDPYIVAIGELTDPLLAEPFEGVLIQGGPVTVVVATDGNGDFVVNGPLKVGDLIYSFGSVAIGTCIQSITGVLHYEYGEFKLEPRWAEDFVVCE
jgi:Notch-like protein